MEAELRNFQATVFSLCEAELRHFRAPSNTLFYMRNRNFKSQYIPYVEAELPAKEYSMCGSGTPELRHIIVCVRKRNFKSYNSLYVESLWFLMQEFESPGQMSKPSWRFCSQLCHLGGGPYWDCFSLLRSFQA